MSDYAWDIFVSYKRGGACAKWVCGDGREALELLLADHIASPRVFVDEKGAVNGADAMSLFDDLARSRLLLVLWTPSYNESDYCVSEWATMRARCARAQALGLPGDLIYPVVYTRLPDVPVTILGERPMILSHADFSDAPPNPYGGRQDRKKMAVNRLRPIVADLVPRLRTVPPCDCSTPPVPATPLPSHPLPFPSCA